jgi:hypothetical protein
MQEMIALQRFSRFNDNSLTVLLGALITTASECGRTVSRARRIEPPHANVQGGDVFECHFSAPDSVQEGDPWKRIPGAMT